MPSGNTTTFVRDLRSAALVPDDALHDNLELPGRSNVYGTALLKVTLGKIKEYVAESVGPGGATTLDGLTDVDTSTTPPSDGEVLKFDNASGLWKPGPDAVGATTLDGLADVDTSTTPPTDGQVLKFDHASGLWKPGADNVGSGGGATTLDGLTDVDTSTTPPTNGQVLEFDSASGLWKPGTVSGGGSSPLFPIHSPSASLTTWVNQGTATKTVQPDGSLTLVSSLGNGSTDNIAGVFMPLGSAPWSFTIGFIPTLQGVNYQYVGIALRDSVSGKLITFGAYRDGTSQLWLASNFNSPTAKSGNVLLPASPWQFQGPVYMKIADNGTTRTCSMGWDPHYLPFLNYSVASGTFLTPDQIGVFAYNINSTTPCGISLFSWV